MPRKAASSTRRAWSLLSLARSGSGRGRIYRAPGGGYAFIGNDGQRLRAKKLETLCEKITALYRTSRS